jgi:hypothetical protein
MPGIDKLKRAADVRVCAGIIARLLMDDLGQADGCWPRTRVMSAGGRGPQSCRTEDLWC